jgi:fatty acid desaturase
MTVALSAAELNSFGEEMLAIRQSAYASISSKDYHHLRHIIWINRILLCIGFGTAWLLPNPISMLIIGIALTGMWTIVSHHVLHGGYDNVPRIPKRYLSNVFASGIRRYVDWIDWIYPPAWQYEHNVLHHFYTNEKLDPDQPTYRLKAKTSVLSRQVSKSVKLIKLILKISFWKCSYYAFNTMKAYHEKKSYQHDGNMKPYRIRTYYHCILPYITYHFILLPLFFLPLGWQACIFVFVNRVGAELITNWHSFFIIVTNHTGNDLALHEQHFSNKAEFYLYQIRSSCNFATGKFWSDYMYGYLNYQIEHHLFPSLPASHYPKLQPLIKSLCHKYGVPYIQEPLLLRTKKLFAILLGKQTMQYHCYETARDIDR